MTTVVPVNSRPKIKLVRAARPNIRLVPVAHRPTRLAVLPGAVAAQYSADRAVAAANEAAEHSEALELALSAQFVVRALPPTLPAARVLGDTATVSWDWGTGSAVTAHVPDGAITYAKIQNLGADRLLGSIAGGSVEEIPLTQAGRALLGHTSAADQRATLGLDRIDNTSDADKPVSLAQAAADDLRQLLAEKGQPNGYAPLDAGAKVPAVFLPSYVDDTLEFADFGAFPLAGEAGKIYVARATNNVYRWSGSTYVEIAASPGSTDEVIEGSTNLYFTAARVRSTVLTGLSSVAAAVISATDTVIGALQKLQAQISGHAAAIASHSAAIALKANAASPILTGTIEYQGAEVYSGEITPSPLAADTDDYDPPGLATTSRIRLSASAPVALTGIAGGADGRRLVLHNLSASAVTLKDDAGSTAENRFTLNGDLILAQDQSIQIEYDGTTQRWRAIGGIGGGSSSVADGDKGDVVVSGGGTVWTLETGVRAVGYEQSWQNVSGSRSIGVTYQNATGRPIQVNVTLGSSASIFQVSADGVTWIGLSALQSGQYQTVSPIVPSSWRYRVTGGASIIQWVELR